MTTGFTAAERNMDRRDQMHADFEFAKQRLYDTLAVYKGRKMKAKTQKLVLEAIAGITRAQTSIA